LKKLTCWHCHSILPEEKISFRSYCEKCFQDLHICLNCKYYSPEKPNSCEILTVDPVKEKDKRNFCEDFIVKSKDDKFTSFEKAKKLFGEDLPQKKSFDNLFN
jgi:hypothetical protein